MSNPALRRSFVFWELIPGSDLFRSQLPGCSKFRPDRSMILTSTETDGWLRPDVSGRAGQLTERFPQRKPSIFRDEDRKQEVRTYDAGVP